MKWYIVNTLSGAEMSAYKSLMKSIEEADPATKALFGEVLVPTTTVVDPTKKNSKGRTEKFMPGYMMIQMEMDEKSYRLVNSISKIVGFIGRPSARGGMASPERSAQMLQEIPAMSEAEVEKVKSQMNLSVEKVVTTVEMNLKDKVRVTNGPFVNFEGTVEAVDNEKRRISVNLSILGRVMPIDLDFSQVERVNA
ncbi:MAG: transcription termination/antitermination factor NusG [Proteobacteria bacterium]|jgi:transcriptional antiterminator NusG|nr:transcription termination/antitermination factor NusG [Pseudomonadota bacterium]